jgi:hypothetical protein
MTVKDKVIAVNDEIIALEKEIKAKRRTLQQLDTFARGTYPQFDDLGYPTGKICEGENLPLSTFLDSVGISYEKAIRGEG